VLGSSGQVFEWQDGQAQAAGAGRSSFDGRLAGSNRHDQTIAAPGYGLDKTRRRGRIVERVAQPIDGFIQPVLEIEISLARPKPVLQFLAAHHFARIFQQHGKDLKCLLRQADFEPLLAQLSGFEVCLEGPETGDLHGSRHANREAFATVYASLHRSGRAVFFQRLTPGGIWYVQRIGRDV
jgi:hypothetical protein